MPLCGVFIVDPASYPGHSLGFPNHRSSAPSLINCSERGKGSEWNRDVAGRDIRLAGVDPDQGSTVFPRNAFARQANRRDPLPCPTLDHRQLRAAKTTQPRAYPAHLGVGARRLPLEITEHQDIWPRQGAALRAFRQAPDCPHRLRIDLDSHRASRKDPDPTLVRALHALEAAVNFDNLLRGQSPSARNVRRRSR